MFCDCDLDFTNNQSAASKEMSTLQTRRKPAYFELSDLEDDDLPDLDSLSLETCLKKNTKAAIPALVDDQPSQVAELPREIIQAKGLVHGVLATARGDTNQAAPIATPATTKKKRRVTIITIPDSSDEETEPDVPSIAATFSPKRNTAASPCVSPTKSKVIPPTPSSYREICCDSDSEYVQAKKVVITS